ncbi:MAG: class I SAM-dependent methyltransferase [Ignavibacteriae bacterium]|nr:class I SAM-dependent methyltransferase [Ignavibacteriota bacterium]
MERQNCRFCNNKLEHTFVDLGEQPLCNNNIHVENQNQFEEKYPLKTFICSNCFLVQTSYNINPSSIYKDYTYFSSYSTSWMKHAKKYTEMITKKLNLSNRNFVVEIASNDGYLLGNFVKTKIPCLGIEPSATVAEVANKNNIKTICEFFTKDSSNKLSKEYSKADLIIANNVFAHVPDINDFTAGLKIMLKDKGVITIEFPYLVELIKNNQFDTIYHEHFFYYSFYSASNILKKHGLKLFDVEKLNTHGGSLRLYVTHIDNKKQIKNKNVLDIQSEEEKLGITNLDYYSSFLNKIKKKKKIFIEILKDIKKQNKTIAGYGAPGKGNTLLNYYNIDSTIIDFTVDRNPIKQNTLLPGSRIPVYSLDKIIKSKPDYILILPWNLKNEIISNLQFVKEWGAKFIIPIPDIEII